MIVKILLIASVMAVLVWVIRSGASAHRLAIARLAGLAVAGLWIVAVINPNLVSRVANLIGVERGTDLVLYILVVVFTATSVGQYQRLHSLDDRLADMVRSQALLKRELDDQRASHPDPAD